MSAGTPLAPEDAARLHMGAPHNPMVVVALLVLERSVPTEALMGVVEERLARHARFRCRVVDSRVGIGAPRWVEDRDFDARRHVATTSLPECATQADLDRVVGDAASRPLDARRPLWRVLIVHVGSARTALVVCVHHVLADGAALNHVLEGLADGAGDEAASPSARRGERGGRGARGLAVARVARGLRGALELLTTRADPRSPLRGRPGARKRYGVSSPFDVAALKAAAHARRTTVTALLLAAVTRALGETYLRGASPLARSIHALVPVSTRRQADDAVANRYVSVFVPLPRATSEREACVLEVDAALRAEREEGSVRSGASVVRAAGTAPRFVERAGVELFSRRASLMVSSVRAAERPLRVAGAALGDLVAWAPVPGRVALGVTLTSFAGRARVAVAADARVLAEPSAFVQALESELSELLAAPPLRERA